MKESSEKSEPRSVEVDGTEKESSEKLPSTQGPPTVFGASGTKKESYEKSESSESSWTHVEAGGTKRKSSEKSEPLSIAIEGTEVFALEVQSDSVVASVIEAQSVVDEVPVLVLASEESVAQLARPGRPFDEMSVEYDQANQKFVWKGCPENGFDPGESMTQALKDGILERVKKFKLTQNGPWLYDIQATPEYAQGLCNAVAESVLGSRSGSGARGSSSGARWTGSSGSSPP